MGLHRILSIVDLLAGSVLLGILEMLLAVPVSASIQMIVVALVPKLSQEIEIPKYLRQSPAIVATIVQETKKVHAARNATVEPHRSFSEAVEAIEAKAIDAAHSKNASYFTFR